MERLIVLKVSDNDGVDLDGTRLHTPAELAEALKKISRENSNMTVSVHVIDSKAYESIGTAIYGSHRAGFSGERFRLNIDGRPQKI